MDTIKATIHALSRQDAQMDTIKGLKENIESEFAEAIAARDQAIATLKTRPGLGPPDLCWLQKTPISSFGGGPGESQGYYHWLLGNDVSSSAAVAAYFASISLAAEEVPFLTGLFLTSEYKIERGFYCCYDPFTRCDLRCELTVPGGVHVASIDSEGLVHEAEPEQWVNVQAAAFLRCQLYGAELAAAGEGVVRFDPVPTKEIEARVFSAVETLYRAKVLPKALESLSEDPAAGCTAEHMDLVCCTILHTFAQRQRWNSAEAFFMRLLDVYPAASVYAAAAQRELAQEEESMNTLTAALERDPMNPQILTAMADMCLHNEQVEFAAKLARRAIRIRGTARPPWLTLARCYVKLQQHDLAMITLNVVPSPPMPQEEWDTLHVDPPPRAQKTTKPAYVRYDPDIEACRRVALEENTLEGSKKLQYLPALVMVNREPLDQGIVPDVGPSRMTCAAVAAGYSILQEIVELVGWNKFLEVRSHVFLMHEETVQGDESPPSEATEGSQKLDAAGDEAGGLGMQDGPEGHVSRQSAPANGSSASAEQPVGSSDAKPYSNGDHRMLAQESPSHPHPPGRSKGLLRFEFKRPPAPAPAVPEAASEVLDLSTVAAARQESVAGPSTAAEADGGVTPQLWSKVFGGRRPPGPVAEGTSMGQHWMTRHHPHMAQGACEPRSSQDERGASCQNEWWDEDGGIGRSWQAQGGMSHGSSGHALAGPVGEGKEEAVGLSAGRGDSLQQDGSGEPAEAASGHGLGAASHAPPSDSRPPPFSRTLESDREIAILGRAFSNAVSGPGKRLCVRWLDELILALWHDLQAFMEWKMRDERLLKTRGQTHAGLLLGLPSHGQPQESGSEKEELPLVTMGDWMRRGLLAERLFHEDETLEAYQACLALGFCMTAATALLRLLSERHMIQETLRVIVQLFNWHDAMQPFSKHRRLPQVVVRAVSQLASEAGALEDVRAAAAQLPGGNDKALLVLFADMERWLEHLPQDTSN